MVLLSTPFIVFLVFAARMLYARRGLFGGSLRAPSSLQKRESSYSGSQGRVAYQRRQTMRTLLLLPLLLMLVSPGQNGAAGGDGSPLAVLGFKWSKSRQTVVNP